MRTNTVEIYQDKGGEWRFRVLGANSEPVAASEGYTDRAGALRGARTLERIMLSIPDIVLTDD
jgi:uncharacterized protein